ncbi:hypothetical protein C0995_003456 [Termitomyces sp. Mi166|nr:hypothetical protein C0995_003456 [Termitomyces sp. Mi166\
MFFSLTATANESDTDHVDETIVATPLPDGYWIEAFPFKPGDTPDIIAYGLGFLGKPSAIKFLINPVNSGSSGWKVNEIASLDFPVGLTYADLTGNGFNDVIIVDRYGPSMNNVLHFTSILWDAATNNGGRIRWLRNPGVRDSPQAWEAHDIGNSTGMHRIAAGHFTTSDQTQVLALPIIPRSSDLTSPAPILVFTPVYGSDPTQGPTSWNEDVAFDSEFRLIHDARVLSKTNEDLDMILVAGREGIVLLWFDKPSQAWKYNVVGDGLPQSGNNPYWGSGSLDVCRVDDDEIGYIATSEAFHGNVVSVYVKKPGAPTGVEALKDRTYWERIVLGDFGPLNDQYTGTIHHVKAIQIGPESVPQSFALACMGAPIGTPENQGVYIYTPVNLTTGEFKRVKITDQSAGRVAAASFSQPTGQDPDIASISYYVPDYFTGLDPPNVRIDTLSSRSLEISALRLNKDILLLIPRPSVIPEGQYRSLPFWILAGKRITLVVLPPQGTYDFNETDAVKVIFGTIIYGSNGGVLTRGIAPAAKTTQSTLVPSPITAGDDGAVFLRIEVLNDQPQGPFSTMSDVTSLNDLPNNAYVSADARLAPLPFIKVDTMDWASSGLWNNFEFYNVTGFHVHFNDDTFDSVVHMQAWTLGLGETARFHDHTDKSFCEIHFCLSNGGGTGGMQTTFSLTPARDQRYFPDDYTEPIDPAAELTRTYVETNSTLLVVPDMHEHGPLWKIQAGSQARPVIRPDDTVDYPWHAWLASRFGDWTLPIVPALPSDQQKYDVWMAFEFPSTAFQY